MIKISDTDLHDHFRARMEQRGVLREEVERVLNEGWEAGDAKLGTVGKVLVFLYGRLWEGKYFEEKEVSVYYKIVNDSIALLTVKARYGKGFSRREGI